ncbi:MAG: porin [Flavobacteriales bacterium]|nr:porin [Flavobacteriales bacterium]
MRPTLILLFVLTKLLTLETVAQNDTAWSGKPQLDLTVFLETFYSYSINRPETETRQPFLYNYNRHSQFNLNLGLLKFSLTHAKYRAGLALQVGTYVADNYAAEPPVLKNIHEASIGLAIDRKNKLWLDAGIFGSHIGFESAIGTDNWTLTRSLIAENSPYFLAGAKLSYSPTSKIDITALVLNGWQRIRTVGGNSIPSFGTQLSARPSSKFSFNWSTFIGTDDPDTTRRMRYFSNLYSIIAVSKRVGITLGFDAGIQQRSRASNAYEAWFGAVIIGRVKVSNRWYLATRAEYYHDRSGVIVAPLNGYAFTTFGLSVNADFVPIPNLFCRVEARWLNAPARMFETNNGHSMNDVSFTASIAYRLKTGLIKSTP